MGALNTGDRVSPLPLVLKLLCGHQERRQEKTPEHHYVPTAKLSLSLPSHPVEPDIVGHEWHSHIISSSSKAGWPCFRIQSLPILEKSDSGLGKASKLSGFWFPHL